MDYFNNIQATGDYSETLKKVIDPKISYMRLAKEKIAERKLMFPNDLQNYYYQPEIKHLPCLENKINEYLFN
jgi:hypothetical protein